MIWKSIESSGNALHFDVLKHAYLATVTVATCGKAQMPQNKTKAFNIVNRTSCRTPAANDTIMGTK